MDNKNLDGQLSFDGQLDDATPKSTQADNKNETVEFEIGKPEKKENLIFEIEKNTKEQKPREEIAEPVVEEFILGAKPEAAENNSKPNEEPVVPVTTSLRRRSLYVPRFTEVSENHRRKIDPRILSAYSDQQSNSQVEEAPYEPRDFSAVDPTEEMDYAPRNPVFVNVTPQQPEPDMLNVFKFADTGENAAVEENVEEKNDAAVIDDEAEEAQEIESIQRLISKEDENIAQEDSEESAASEETVEEVEEVEEAVAESEENTSVIPEDYTLPDPDSEIHIEDFIDSSSPEANKSAPDGVREDEPTQDKKKLSEYTHQSQRDSLKDVFLDSLMAVRIRMGVIGMFSILLLVFELLSATGVLPMTVLPGSDNYGTAAFIDILFVGCIFILTLPEIARAFKHLAKGKLLPELSLVASFVVLLVSSIVPILAQAREYSLYGFIFAVSALSATFATYYRICGDFMAFKQVSKNSVKKILDVKLTRELEDENVALDGIVDEYNSKTARIYRTAFVADFMANTSESSENNNHTVTMLAVPFAVAILSAVVCFFIPGGIVAASSAFALVFLLGCPAFSMLSRKISYVDSQQLALSEESAMIGEKSYFDFSEVDVIAFEDTEIFGAEDVNLKRFMLYGDRDNIEKAMRQMYSLFSVVGGPLYKIFANALDNRVRHAPATNVVIEADGVSGNLSGKTVYAGTEEYMRRLGIAVPQASGRPEFGVDTTKVMYAAENGEVYAKFYIRYSFSEEFTRLLPALKEERIVPLIYTSDPNLSNELLKMLTAGADCMRVVKKYEPASDNEKIYRRVSANVVTYGDKINAMNVVLLARKYREFAERVSISELYSISLAAAAGVLLSVLGVALPSLYYGLWHLAWCAALKFVSKRAFEIEKKDKEK